MTDAEWLQLLQEKTPDQLTLAEIADLHDRIRSSAELRDALSEQLRLEEFLHQTLGRAKINVDDILDLANGGSSPRGWQRWAWGLVVLFALVPITLFMGALFGKSNKRNTPNHEVADAFPTEVAKKSTESTAEETKKRWTNFAHSIDSQSQAPAHDKETTVPPGKVFPAPEPASAGAKKMVSAPESNDQGKKAGNGTPAHPVANGTNEANNPKRSDGDQGGRASGPSGVAADTARGEPKQPWQAVLDARGDLPPFEEAAFGDRTVERAGMPFTLVEQWVRPWQGRVRQFRDRPPLLEGINRLRAPWIDGAALRVGFSGKPVSFRFWQGNEGAMFQFYGAEFLAGYQIQRTQPKSVPDSVRFTGLDDGRYRRIHFGTIDFHYHQGTMIACRGNIRLVTIPMPRPPDEIYVEGNCYLWSLDHVRSAPPPEPALPERAADRFSIPLQRRPWQVQGDGLQWNINNDHSMTLLSNEKSKGGWAVAPTPRDAVEFLLEIVNPTPGSGMVFLDDKNKPKARLAFLHSPITIGGITTTWVDVHDERTAQARDYHSEPYAYIGQSVWLRLVFGAGGAKCWVGVDGKNWGRMETPRMDWENMRPHHLGVYVRGGKGQITLRQCQGRVFPRISALAPLEFVAQAPVARHQDLQEWRSRARGSRPEGVDVADWERASALRALAAGTTSRLGNQLLLFLLDEGLQRPLPEALEILAEASRWGNGWEGDSAHDFVREITQRYERLGERLRREGHSRPWSMVEYAYLNDPLWTHETRPTLLAPLVEMELTALVEQEDWAAVRSLCQRLRFWTHLGQSYLGHPAPPDWLEKWVTWAEWHIRQRGAGAAVAGNTSVAPNENLTKTLARRLPPLVLSESKEVYNLLAEMRVALAEQAHGDMARLLQNDTNHSLTGLASALGRAGNNSNTTLANDARLLVSPSAAFALALERNPLLPAALRQQGGAKSSIRLRQALSRQDESAVLAVARQFPATEAAVEAHLWLADRLLAAGNFARALESYRRAEAEMPTDSLPETIARRLIGSARLAGALQGVDGPAPAPSDENKKDRWQSPAFADLMNELRARHNPSNASAAVELLPRNYISRPFAKLDPLTDDVAVLSEARIDWPLRQLATAQGPELFYVSGRHRLLALDSGGRERWRHDYPERHHVGAVPLRPCYHDGRVYVRKPTREGIVLVCLDARNGQVKWSEKPHRNVLSDPIFALDGIAVVTTAPAPNGLEQAMLTVLDPGSGALRRAVPIAMLRDGENARHYPAQALAIPAGILLELGGGLGRLDEAGNWIWARQPMGIRPPDDRWLFQLTHQPPVVERDTVYRIVPGGSTVEAVDLETGQAFWRVSVPNACAIALVNRDTVYVETTRGLTALTKDKGQLLWGRVGYRPVKCLGNVPGAVVLCDWEKVAADQYRPVLCWLDAKGRETMRHPLKELTHPTPFLGPLFRFQDRILFFHGIGSEPHRSLRELVIAKK